MEKLEQPFNRLLYRDITGLEFDKATRVAAELGINHEYVPDGDEVEFALVGATPDQVAEFDKAMGW